jgi:hypothetical protein
MGIASQSPAPITGSAAEEIVRWVRSEPALALFAAQALWIAQPALEIFWPAEEVAAVAEALESANRVPRGGAAPEPMEGGD